jgi:hypothetical protein
VATLKIRSTNPLEHSREIKQLFVAHDRPEFPAFFDRAYPSAVQGGGKSWIGMDDAGRLVLHIACFRQRFKFGRKTVVGGLLGNLMAATEQRTGFPSMTLVRQVIADLRTEGDIDFLYGDPNPQAVGVLKLVGLKVVGTLDRFAFPLAAASWHTTLAIRTYQALSRLRTASNPLRAAAHPADRFDAAVFERPPGETPSLRPYRPAALYHQRLDGYPSEMDLWFTFHGGDDSAPPLAALLVRELPGRVAQLLSISRGPGVPLTDVVPALAAALRARGSERMWISTLSETLLSHELTRAGFIARNDPTSIVAYALTDSGQEVLRAASSWEITDLDCDR